MKHGAAFFSAFSVLAAALFPQILPAGGASGSGDSRPNIIYIMADDMGYSDLGCYGGEIRTPNLDRLASNGIKFRSFYNNARCCPTRASLLTGRYPHEAGMGHMVTPEGAEMKPGPYQGFIDSRFPTIAEYLKQGGYQTYMAGKWHVGERPEHWPLKRGFDHFFGLINGATGYYGVIPREKGKRHIVLEDEEFEAPAEGFYITDAFTDYAIGYLDMHRKEKPQTPFFLYLAYTAPHFPLHAPEEDVARYEAVYRQGWDAIRERRYKKMVSLGLVDDRFSFPARPADIPAWDSVDNKDEWVRKMAVYAAMIDRMDRNIGRLLAQLEENGQLDNTLIVFLSDNGACAENVARRNFNDPAVKIGLPGSYVTYDTPWANVSNTPFRKYKRFLHEGGIITPCIVSWPGHVKPAAGYYPAPAYVTDLLPTAIELAGIRKDGLPGNSLSFLWNGKQAPVRTYYWEHEGNQAVRRGDWKLVKDKEDEDWSLYNLAKDPAERTDLSGADLNRVDELKKLYRKWAAEVGVKGAKEEKKPNIVYILADDLGYGDVSAYNPDGKISTPHIDGLASQGMRFTDAHSPSSVCTPTRYSILTGRYPWRSRKPVGVLRGYSRTLIEPERATVATLLKKHGYETGVIGKWHLGLDWAVKDDRKRLLQKEGYGIEEEMDPEDIDFTGAVSGGPQGAGFSYSYILPASLDMPPYCYLENQVLAEVPSAHTEGSALGSGYTGPFWRPGKMAPSFDFMQVLPAFVQKAKEFLGRQEKQRPFFLFLPLTGPHTPWLPDAGHRGRSAAGEYGDFVQQVDAAVGAVLKELDEQGYSENTIVVFASDNGPFWREEHIAKFGHRAAGPYRGMKADIYEGGHRVPLIVRWPGRVRAGQVSGATTTLANLMATVAGIVGEKNTGYITEDSYSMLSVLSGKSDRVEGQPAVIHNASNGYYAIRDGDWKLIEGLGSGGFTEPATIRPAPGQPAGQLYNLAEDIGETRDLYLENPGKVKELTEKLEAIRRSRERVWSSGR